MDESKPPTDTHAAQATDAAPDIDLSGQTLGDFRVLRRIGQGGMGQVYLAEQISLKRKVALKLLRPETAANAISLQRFKQEAEAVAQATHANIVQIYAIGQEAGTNFMALEYVEGRNLREYVEKKGAPDAGTGLKIMAQVAAALARAGELGIVHRDIKPENILITRQGEVKVADFGLSRCFHEGAVVSLTQSGVTLGTPLYMSPEQVEGRPVDHRSDIYSFGVTCYYMFTGQPPFRGSSPLEVAYQHVNKNAEPLADVRPDLPAELCAVVHKMMAKKPEARHQTAGELAREIGRLRDVLLFAGTMTGLGGSSVNLTAEVPAAATTQIMPTRRRRWLVLAALSVLLALAGGLTAGWLRQRHPQPEAVAPPPAPAPDDAAARAFFSAREHEKELRQRVKDALRADNPLDQLAGLKFSLDLGVMYLNDRRLDDADALFKELRQQKSYPYQLLGRCGKASVLAFRDEPAVSNEQFLVILTEVEKIEKLAALANPNVKPFRKEYHAHKEQIETYGLVWKDRHLRELVARALNHNHANAPAAFPARLEPFRRPPRPVIKGA